MDSEEYEYLKRKDFSSEHYKIQIRGIGRYISNSQLKNYLVSKHLSPHKIKILSGLAFVTFKSEIDRDKSIITLNGVEWKNKKLEVRVAKGKADPCVQKQLIANNCDSSLKVIEMTPEKINEAIMNSFIPLWNKSYPDQLSTKRKNILELLVELRKSIISSNIFLKTDLIEPIEKHNGSALACRCEEIVPSPKTDCYRNKCELTIGKALDGNQPVVGFRYGKYRMGELNVGFPEDPKIISPISTSLIRDFQEFLDQNVIADKGTLKFCKSFDPMDHSGSLRQITVRETQLGDTMLVVDLVHTQLTDDQLKLFCEELVNWFDNRKSSLSSLYVALRKNNSDSYDATTLRLLKGKEFIEETCNGLTFKISPNSFFQVNTKAAELLYEEISTQSRSDSQIENTVLLDVCCGTGTIGLCLAKKFTNVIGIELIPEAVEDAKQNALQNGISNVQFHCGRAEDLIDGIVTNLPLGTKVTAVLDPPRCGLPNSVINTLRQCEGLERIMYVSCNFKAAMENIRAFAQCPSKRVFGDSFIPEVVSPFDLFPHTAHVEVLVSLKRYKLPI